MNNPASNTAGTLLSGELREGDLLITDMSAGKGGAPAGMGSKGPPGGGMHGGVRRLL